MGAPFRVAEAAEVAGLSGGRPFIGSRVSGPDPLLCSSSVLASCIEDILEMGGVTPWFSERTCLSAHGRTGGLHSWQRLPISTSRTAAEGGAAGQHGMQGMLMQPAPCKQMQTCVLCTSIAEPGACTIGVSAGVEEGPAPDPLRRLSATPAMALTMLLADTRPPCQRDKQQLSTNPFPAC